MNNINEEKGQILFPKNTNECYYGNLYVLEYNENIYLKETIEDGFKDIFIINNKNSLFVSREEKLEILKNSSNIDVYNLFKTYTILNIKKFSSDKKNGYIQINIDFYKNNQDYGKLILLYNQNNSDFIEDIIFIKGDKQDEILFLNSSYENHKEIQQKFPLILERKQERLILNKKAVWSRIDKGEGILLLEGIGYRKTSLFVSNNISLVNIIEEDKKLTKLFSNQEKEGYDFHMIVGKKDFIIFINKKEKLINIFDTSGNFIKDTSFKGYDSLIIANKDIENLEKEDLVYLSELNHIQKIIDFLEKGEKYNNKVLSLIFDTSDRKSIKEVPLIKEHKTYNLSTRPDIRFILNSKYENLEKYLEELLVKYYAQSDKYDVGEAEDIVSKEISKVEIIANEKGVMSIRFKCNFKNGERGRIAFMHDGKIKGTIGDDIKNPFQFVYTPKVYSNKEKSVILEKNNKFYYFFLDNSKVLVFDKNNVYNETISKYVAFSLKEIDFTYTNSKRDGEKVKFYILNALEDGWREEIIDTYLVQDIEDKDLIGDFFPIGFIENLYSIIKKEKKEKGKEFKATYSFNEIYSKVDYKILNIFEGKNGWQEGILLEKGMEEIAESGGKGKMDKNVVDLGFMYSIFFGQCKLGKISVFQDFKGDIYIKKDNILKLLEEKSEEDLKFILEKEKIFKILHKYNKHQNIDYIYLGNIKNKESIISKMQKITEEKNSGVEKFFKK